MATSKATEKKIAKAAGKKNITQVREQAGKSNAGKYAGVKKKDFAGPSQTYPINTLERAKSALKLAHNSPDASKVKEKVLKKYPQLKRTGDKK